MYREILNNGLSGTKAGFKATPNFVLNQKAERNTMNRQKSRAIVENVLSGIKAGFNNLVFNQKAERSTMNRQKSRAIVENGLSGTKAGFNNLVFNQKAEKVKMKIIIRSIVENVLSGTKSGFKSILNFEHPIERKKMDNLKSKSTFPATLLALILAVAVFLPSPVWADKVKITCIADGWRYKLMHLPLSKMFNEMQSEIEVKYLAPAKNYGDVDQKVVRASATNTLPDCVFQEFSFLPGLVRPLVARDQLANMQDLIDKEPAGWVEENFTPKMLELGVVDGIQYALPFNTSMMQWYYNNDLLKTVGGSEEDFHNWDSFLKLAPKLKEQGKKTFHGWMLHADDWAWQTLILSQGGRKVDKNGGDKVTFNENGYGVEALKMFKRFYDEADYAVEGEYNQMQTLFTEGKMLAILTSPAGATTIKGQVGGSFDLRSTTFPVWNEEKGLLATGGNAVLILTKDPEKMAAAWEYVKFVTGPKGQTFAAKASGYMAANIRASEPEYLGDYYKENPYFATPGKQYHRAGPNHGYKGTQYQKIWFEQRSIIISVMKGETSAEDGATQMQEVAEKLMQQ